MEFCGLQANSMFNQLFSAHSIKSAIRALAVVIMLLVLVSIIS